MKDPKAEAATLIYLFFNYDSKRLKYSFGETVHPKYWNFSNQRLKKSVGGSLEVNHLLDRVEEEIKKIYRTGNIQNNALSNEYLKERLDKALDFKKKLSKDFFDFLNEFIEVQTPFKTHRTIQKYRTLYNHLSSFQQTKKLTISFEKVDMKFYEQFTTYCINDLKLLNNSIAKYVKTLKTFLHWSTERGYNSYFAFKKFKTKEKDADIIYLTEDELFHLYEYDFSANEKLEKVRDVFCFGCFTGLRYSDILRVKKENIQKNTIEIVSEKTEDRLSIPLIDYAVEILRKYKFDLPVISNQKTNAYLKEIGKITRIDEPVTLTQFRGAQEIQTTRPKYEFLTTHTARRSFVTLSLEKGMRPEMVMSITGHKEYATFKKYIKISAKVKGMEMRKIWSRREQLTATA